MSDPALNIFPNEYVPNAEGVPYHAKWVRANPGEAAKWLQFRNDVIAGKQVSPPQMSTAYGRALVAAGKEHMNIGRFVGQLQNPFPPPDPTPPPPPPPPPPTGGRGYGVNMYTTVSFVPRVVSLGAKVVRADWAIGSPATALDAVVGALKSAGIRTQPLADFYGRTPTVAEAQNLGSWAQRHGPNGTDSIRWIEMGNETSYGYQYNDGVNDASYQTRAMNYALRVKDAALAVAPYGVGILCQAEDGGSGSSMWVDKMFQAVPDLPNYVAGWTIHPYGSPTYDTGGGGKINRMKNFLAAKGETTKPWYLTEWGVASDNGRDLTGSNNNYGWGDVTYQQAADAWASTEPNWISQLGTRWAQTIIFGDGDGQPAGGPSVDNEGYFGLLRSDGTDKGPLTAFARTKFAASPLS